jgi:TatD DNase family protein
MIVLPENTVFIDIHTHNPAQEKGILRIFNITLAEFPGTGIAAPVSTGLHPWDIDSFERDDELRSMLVSAAASDRVVAIGETGIDKVISTPVVLQEEIFRIHVDISEESGKPLIIHCVRSFQEVIRIRKETSASQPWIFHGFNSSSQMAGELAEMGCYISIGARLLKNPVKVFEIIEAVSLKQIFAETDDDEKAISGIYHEITGLTGMLLDDLADRLKENYIKVFKG